MEAAQAAPAVVSKGEFAQLINVSAGRVSQYISEGKLTGDALVGEGRSARINVAVARQQLRRRIDVGQRFGNGATTRLDFEAEEPEEGASRARERSNPVADAIAEEKLKDLRSRNREAAEKELARRGTYVLASEVSAAMAGMAGGMLTVFEGALSDLATSISAKFELPQRDVLHLLRQEFTALRAKASEAARRRAEVLPALVMHEPDLDEEGDPA